MNIKRTAKFNDCKYQYICKYEYVSDNIQIISLSEQKLFPPQPRGKDQSKNKNNKILNL